MEATLNVRMSAPLKERGDKVLHDNGISASAAVRALWQEMATTRTLPAFMQDLKDDSAAKKAKRLSLEALAGVGEGTLSALSDEELEAIGKSRYE
ncbi:MAG: type II toxin-antitoxin system RelB/DinJ family antitoxin [Eggerthellaceae bacterium]|nr:type II toxin-antitoxin system RelB/DinJ family antitoxin [Eggerthellaceae bacterium]